jgi:hypothetical protein
MPKFEVNFVSSFYHSVYVEAETKEQAEELAKEEDYVQKHISENVIQVKELPEGMEWKDWWDQKHDEGMW